MRTMWCTFPRVAPTAINSFPVVRQATPTRRTAVFRRRVCERAYTHIYIYAQFQVQILAAKCDATDSVPRASTDRPTALPNRGAYTHLTYYVTHVYAPLSPPRHTRYARTALAHVGNACAVDVRGETRSKASVAGSLARADAL